MKKVLWFAAGVSLMAVLYLVGTELSNPAIQSVGNAAISSGEATGEGAKVQGQIQDFFDKLARLNEQKKSAQEPTVLIADDFFKNNNTVEESSLVSEETPAVGEEVGESGGLTAQEAQQLKEKREKIFQEFSAEVKYYEFNDRFDLKKFLTDPRLTELDGEKGGQLIDYVFEKLQGIALLQSQADATHLLVDGQ